MNNEKHEVKGKRNNEKKEKIEFDREGRTKKAYKRTKFFFFPEK